MKFRIKVIGYILSLFVAVRALTLIDTVYTGDCDYSQKGWFDGTYAHVMYYVAYCDTTTFKAFKYEGDSLRIVADTIPFDRNYGYSWQVNGNDVIGSNQYIYMCFSYVGLAAFTFNGSQYVQVADTTRTFYYDAIDISDTLILASSWDHFAAFTFNGSSFIMLDSIYLSAALRWYSFGVNYSNGYMYNITDHLWALAFDGSNLTVADSIPVNGVALAVNDDVVFTGISPDKIRVYKNNAGSLDSVYQLQIVNTTIKDLYHSGTYLYVSCVGTADTKGLYVYDYVGDTLSFVDSSHAFNMSFCYVNPAGIFFGTNDYGVGLFSSIEGGSSGPFDRVCDTLTW